MDGGKMAMWIQCNGLNEKWKHFLSVRIRHRNILQFKCLICSKNPGKSKSKQEAEKWLEKILPEALN